MAMVTRLPGSEYLYRQSLNLHTDMMWRARICLLVIPLSDVGLGGHPSEILHLHIWR